MCPKKDDPVESEGMHLAGEAQAAMNDVRDMDIGEVDGFDLKEPREAAQALAALKQERDVSIMILRNEELTEVLFSIGN